MLLERIRKRVRPPRVEGKSPPPQRVLKAESSQDSPLVFPGVLAPREDDSSYNDGSRWAELDILSSLVLGYRCISPQSAPWRSVPPSPKGFPRPSQVTKSHTLVEQTLYHPQATVLTLFSQDQPTSLLSFSPPLTGFNLKLQHTPAPFVSTVAPSRPRSSY